MSEKNSPSHCNTRPCHQDRLAPKPRAFLQQEGRVCAHLCGGVCEGVGLGVTLLQEVSHPSLPLINYPSLMTFDTKQTTAATQIWSSSTAPKCNPGWRRFLIRRPHTAAASRTLPVSVLTGAGWPFVTKGGQQSSISNTINPALTDQLIHIDLPSRPLFPLAAPRAPIKLLFAHILVLHLLQPQASATRWANTLLCLTVRMKQDVQLSFPWQRRAFPVHGWSSNRYSIHSHAILQ